jgi:hypothetical protein
LRLGQPARSDWRCLMPEFYAEDAWLWQML